MLGKCRNRAMLRKSLATLPPTLDQTYDRILCAISKEDSEYALRILQWLTFSARPLFVEEVAEVVAINVVREPAFDHDEVLEDPLEVLNICSSLVTITTEKKQNRSSPERKIIALAHYSVQEYLTSDRIKQGQAKQYSMQEAECHSAIAIGSLEYLMQLQQPLSEEALKLSKLARYSAQFWSSHFRKIGSSTEKISQVGMRLLCTENPAYLSWIQSCDPDDPWKEPDLQKGIGRTAAPLYYAAKLGLNTMIKLLLERGADINAQVGLYGTALQAASAEGHEQVVEILLAKHAEVNVEFNYRRSALQEASMNGHKQIVKMLLDKGADVDAQGGFYGSVLYAASAGGYEQIVKMLLDKGADVDTQGGFYDSALYAASAGGYEQIVKMLLDKGADVDAQGGFYDSALYTASAGGYEQIVKMLLDKGADVDAQGGDGSALYAATTRGHKQIVKTLLDKGADVDAQGGFYGSALYAASAGGYEQIVKMLLDKGADFNAQTQRFSVIEVASAEGHEQIVKMLLEAGAVLTLK
jgi:ankyrin repeat protein